MGHSLLFVAAIRRQKCEKRREYGRRRTSKTVENLTLSRLGHGSEDMCNSDKFVSRTVRFPLLTTERGKKVKPLILLIMNAQTYTRLEKLIFF